MRSAPVTCPVCGKELRGHATTGYRCGRCHAYYSTRHVRAMRREQFRSLIQEHFGAKSVPPRPRHTPAKVVDRVESDLVIAERRPEVERALAQAKREAAQAAQHLEDFVGVAERVEEDSGALRAVTAALPMDALRHEPRPKSYTPKSISVATKRSPRKKTVRKAVRKQAVTKRAVKRPVRKKPTKKRVTRRRR